MPPTSREPPNAVQALSDALAVTGGILCAAHDDRVVAVAFSPDGRYLATASADTTARVWDLRATDPSASPIVLRGHDDAVKGVAFSPDGRYLATGSDDMTARVWDLQATDPSASPRILRGHNDAVSAVAFSPDGYSLATAGF